MIQEPDLVKQAREGDADAVGSLYELYCDRVYSYVFTRLGNATEAEDVTAQVFLKMVEKIGEFEWQGAGFAAWLFRIAHNQIIDNVRRHNRQPQAPLDLAYAVASLDGHSPEQQAEQREFREQLKVALVELSDLQAQVVLLKYAAELSNIEIAEVLSRSTNAVNSLHYEGLKKLKKVLIDKGYTF